MGEQEQKRFFPEVISNGKSHRDCFQGSTRHEFSSDDDVGTVIQDLQDLSPRLFPNSAHDQYLNFDQFSCIRGICRLDLEQVNNQQVLEAVCTFLCQNLKDFQWSDHLQIVANFHRQLNVAQRRRESPRTQRVVQDFLQVLAKLEDQLQH
jgi:hypothetical protein